LESLGPDGEEKKEDDKKEEVGTGEDKVEPLAG